MQVGGVDMEASRVVVRPVCLQVRLRRPQTNVVDGTHGSTDACASVFHGDARAAADCLRVSVRHR